jgi:hypothetical protein
MNGLQALVGQSGQSLRGSSLDGFITLQANDRVIVAGDGEISKNKRTLNKLTGFIYQFQF